MRMTSLLAAIAMAGLSACSPAEAPSPDASIAAAPGSVLEVTGAFIIQPAPGRDVAGGGLVLSVQGAPMWLTGASTDIADTVELHTMSMEDGMMRMRQVDRFEVTEETPLVLERGGRHLMLFGVHPDIQIGDSADIVLTLTDENGAEQTLVTEAEIRSLAD